MILLLGIYPKEMITISKRSLYLILIAALFIIAETWKKLKCAWTDEWMKEMYRHTHRSIT